MGDMNIIAFLYFTFLWREASFLGWQMWLLENITWGSAEVLNVCIWCLIFKMLLNCVDDNVWASVQMILTAYVVACVSVYMNLYIS